MPYGGRNGLTSTNDQLIHQDIAGLLETVETAGAFGHAAAWGDGIQGLAVGVLYEDLGAAADAGAAHVMYGALSIPRHQLRLQDSPGIRGACEADDFFGSAMSH